MAKITIAKIEPAAGDNHPTIITDDTGAKMSGFAPALRELRPGDVIDVEIKPKGKYLNITSFKVIEKAALRQAQGERNDVPDSSQAMAHEYTRRVERDIDARYRTAALKEAVNWELRSEDATMTTVLMAADEFYRWLSKRQGSVSPVSAEQVPTPAPRVEQPAPRAEQQSGADETGSNKKAAVPAPPDKTGADADFEKLGHEKTEQGKSFVDWGIIGNNLITLGRQDPANWNEEAVTAFMLKTYHATGKTPAEIAAKLTEGEAKHFTNKIKQALLRDR